MSQQNAYSKPDGNIVPPPKKGLGSRSNYALWEDSDCDCSCLRKLSVKISIDEAVKCESATGDTLGFSFQLNTYSNQDNSAWQQYIVALRNDDLHGVINNWKYEPARDGSERRDNRLKSIIDYPVKLCTLSDNTVPKGYAITISPFTNEEGEICGVNFKVTNESGITLANETQDLLKIPGVTKSDLAPIVALEMVLVGLPNDVATLSSGAGAFEYSASHPLMVSSKLPPCVASRNGTAEAANTSYGTLDAGPATPITQTFTTVTPP